jgi:hypothetical protein
MKIRKVKKNDYIKIKFLFKKNNLKFYTLNTWYNLWKSLKLSKDEKNSLGWVIEYKKNIIGHLGNFFSYYNFKKKKIKCSVLNGWVVDRKYRHASLALIKKYFDQKNCDFFYGTTFSKNTATIVKKFSAKPIPVNNFTKSYYIITDSKKVLYFFFRKNFFLKKLIVNLINFFINLLLFYKINYWKKEIVKKKIVMLNELKPDLNRFLETHSKKNKKLTLDTSTFLFQSTLKNLIARNKIWFLVIYEANKIVGCSTCLIFKNKGIRASLLLNLIAENKTCYRSLIKENLVEAEKRGCMYLNFKNFSQEKIRIIENFKPFIKNLPNNNFYYKSNSIILKNLLKKHSSWNPSSFDGDILLNY